MKLRVAFQMESMEQTAPGETTSLILMEEACRRGHRVFHYRPEALTLLDGKVLARGTYVKVDTSKKVFYSQGAEEVVDIGTMDMVHVRQHPPFDMRYVTSTYILERIRDKVLLLNDAFWIRNCPEKFFPHDFLQFMPPTLISQDMELLLDFYESYRHVVVKPLYEYHGRGIFQLEPRDPDAVDKLEAALKQYNEPIIMQKFLPEIFKGNKRIIFFDGKVVGAICTTPPAHEFRVYRDSVDSLYELDEDDKEICKAIGKELKKRDLFFVGIDLIGHYLTEINVTCTATLMRLNRMQGGKMEAKYWDAAEKRLVAFRKQ